VIAKVRRDREQDEGAALIEFVVLAVMVMVPLGYAVAVIVKVHASTFGAVTAAREAGRAYVTSENPSQAAARARAAARLALSDQGAEAPQVVVHCLDGGCLSPGSRVRVEVTTRVAIPFVPTRGGSNGGTIPVTAVNESVVDSYRNW
jgi:Flp pilus assembly pilin Flp